MISSNSVGIRAPLTEWRPPCTSTCTFILVQTNKYVIVCASVLRRGYSGDGCLSSSILFKYECMVGNLFVLSWARVVLFRNNVR